MIKAVLFDLDGTLVNTLDDLAVAVNFAITKHGFASRSVEEIKQYIGDGNFKMIQRALPENSRDEKTVNACLEDFFAYYKEHCADLSKPYCNIVLLLGELKKNGIMTCIVTNKADSMTQILVPKVFGKVFEFDFVLGQQPDVPKKPQPHMAYIAMNEIGVNADECLFVGDSYTDMLTGGNSGNIPVGVLWGYRDEKELRESGARFIVKEPMQILELIKEINQ